MRRIRREFRGPESGGQLAAELDITHSTVWSIAHRRTWRRLPPEPGDFVPGETTERATGREHRSNSQP